MSSHVHVTVATTVSPQKLRLVGCRELVKQRKGLATDWILSLQIYECRLAETLEISLIGRQGANGVRHVLIAVAPSRREYGLSPGATQHQHHTAQSSGAHAACLLENHSASLGSRSWGRNEGRPSQNKSLVLVAKTQYGLILVPGSENDSDLI